MRRWRHPTSRDLWVAAHPAPSELRGCCPRSHRNWAFFKTPTRCETSQATTQITSCSGLGLRPQFPSKRSPSRFLQVNPEQARCCRTLHSSASRGSKVPPGPSRTSGLQPAAQASHFGGFPGHPWPQAAARAFPRGPHGRKLKLWGNGRRLVGFRVFPSRAKSMYIVRQLNQGCAS